MTVQEMGSQINDYIGRYWGTEVAEALYRKRCMIWDGDNDAIEALYREFEHEIA